MSNIHIGPAYHMYNVEFPVYCHNVVFILVLLCFLLSYNEGLIQDPLILCRQIHDQMKSPHKVEIGLSIYHMWLVGIVPLKLQSCRCNLYVQVEI